MFGHSAMMFRRGCFIDGDPVSGDGGLLPDGDGTQKPERTFTQAELDAILGDRLARERQKYADYEDMRELTQELTAFGYSGTPAEIKQAVKTAAEQYRKQAELESLQDEADRTGTTPELLSEIRQLKAELAAIKKDKTEAQRQAEYERQRQANIQAQLDEFSKKYPDIDQDKLGTNPKFVKFLQRSNPNLTITQIYEDFIEFVGGAESEAVAKLQANIERSTSSGRDRGEASGGTYGLTPRQQALAKDAGMPFKEYATLLKQIKK